MTENCVISCFGAGFSCQTASAVRRPVASDAAATGTARRHSGFGGAAGNPCDGVRRGAGMTASISARRSPIACQRRFGLFSRQRRSRSGIVIGVDGERRATARRQVNVVE
jgi:hypothetical protein